MDGLQRALEYLRELPDGPEKETMLADLFDRYPELQKIMAERLRDADMDAQTQMPRGVSAGNQFVAAPLGSHLAAGLRQGLGQRAQQQQYQNMEDLMKRQSDALRGVGEQMMRPKSEPSPRMGGGVTPEQEMEWLIRAESGGRPDAVSPAGAIGLTQVMPATGAEMGYSRQDLFNPEKNREAGSRYFSQQLRRFKSPRLANAAYNAGPGRIGKLTKRYGNSWDAIEPYVPEETRGYVNKIDRWRRGGS